MEQNPSLEADSYSAKKFPSFCRTRYLSVSWAKLIPFPILDNKVSATKNYRPVHTVYVDIGMYE